MTGKKKERTRRWVFTENNPQQSASELVKRLTSEYAVRYIIVGNEIAPETGTAHLQGFVEFEHPATFDQVRKRLPRAHVESALGSNKQNREYCAKSGDFVEVGTLTRRVTTSEHAHEVVSRIVKAGEHPASIAVDSPDLSAYVVTHFHNLCKIWEMRHVVKEHSEAEAEGCTRGE